jgi:hypothetical protein
MNVVQRRVVVHDFKLLSGLYPQDVGRILAALLVEFKFRCGRIELPASQPFLDVDQDVPERRVLVDHHLFADDDGLVLLHADRIGVHHDFGFLRGGPREGDFPRHVAGRSQRRACA